MITRYSILFTLFFATFASAVDPKESKLQEEEAIHQGIWQVTSFMRNGKETAKETVDSIERLVDGKHVVWKRDGKRFAGTTKYKMRQMLLLSFNAIITFSTTPIRLIQWIGLMLTVLGSVALFGLLLVSIIVDFRLLISFLICLNLIKSKFLNL
jgi:hypothetical protein